MLTEATGFEPVQVALVPGDTRSVFPIEPGSKESADAYRDG